MSAAREKGGGGNHVVAAVRCERCGEPLQNPQRCRKCGALQSPDPRRDHFATLALPRAFDVDLAALERNLVSFGKDLHPDLAGANPCDRARSVVAAASVNEAYGVLKDPYRRAEYLLRHEGGKSAHEDKRVPPGFLEEMLDERMRLEEALAGGGEELERVRAALQAKLEEIRAELSTRFAALAAAEPAAREPLLRGLRETLNRMAYYRGLLRDLREGVRARSES